MARVIKTLPFRARLLMLPVMQTLFRHTHLSVCRNVVLYQEAKKSNIEAGLSIAFQTPATAPRSTPLNISLEHCSNMLLDWSSQVKAATLLQLQARGINMKLPLSLYSGTPRNCSTQWYESDRSCSFVDGQVLTMWHHGGTRWHHVKTYRLDQIWKICWTLTHFRGRIIIVIVEEG